MVGVLGSALVALGSGAFLVASSLEAGDVRIQSANRPVNPGAEDPMDIRAHNSPAVAVNPRQPANLAVAARIDTPSFSCALHVSFDGGSEWSPTELPFPAGEELPARCFAPDVAFGPRGVLYLSFVTLKGAGNVPNAVWISSSTDGGRTLSQPVQVAGPLAFQVRLLADQRTPERLYMSWVQAAGVGNLLLPSGQDHPVVVSRSDDGGAVWSPPIRASSASRQRVIAPSTALGREGELYLLYLDVGEDSLDYHGAHEGRGGEPYPGRWSLVLARSVDEGRTWDESVVEGQIVPAGRFIVFFPPFPSLAVDQQSGRVYAAFHDARLGDPDVWVWTSTDGGSRFGPPRRVNDTAEGDGTSQYLPKLSVAPDGRLDVLYYDRRSDPQNVMNEASLQSSDDGGHSFSPRLRLSDRLFDSRVGFGSERDLPDLGSRLGLVSSRQRAVAVWTDTRAGTQESNKQDLGRAVVVFSAPAALRSPLRLGGGVMAAIGLLVVAWWTVATTRRRT